MGNQVLLRVEAPVAAICLVPHIHDIERECRDKAHRFEILHVKEYGKGNVREFLFFPSTCSGVADERTLEAKSFDVALLRACAGVCKITGLQSVCCFLKSSWQSLGFSLCAVVLFWAKRL